MPIHRHSKPVQYFYFYHVHLLNWLKWDRMQIYVGFYSFYMFYQFSVMSSNEQTLNIMLDLNLTSWKTLRNQQKLLLWMQMDAWHCPSDNCFLCTVEMWLALCSCDIAKAKLWKQTSLLSFLLCARIRFCLFSLPLSCHPSDSLHIFDGQTFQFSTQTTALLFRRPCRDHRDQIHLTGWFPRCHQDAGCSFGVLVCTWQLLPQSQFGSAPPRQVRKAWKVCRSCQLVQD